MRDIHCHILPGVDDGAKTLNDSLEMLAAAKAAGITSIVATPHVRDPYFKDDSYEKYWQAYWQLCDAAGDFPITMGFEVNHRKLMDYGLGWAEALREDDSNVILLELSTGAPPSRFGDYERTIFELQGMGYDVIIAHPERYIAIQKDIHIAEELVRMGCRLQASADFIEGGRLGREKGPAKAMLKAGLYSFIASDAHYPDHYRLFAKAHERYGHLLRG